MAEFSPQECVLDALRTHSDALKRFVGGRAHPDEVDDLLQVAALRAVERAETLKDAARVIPWLYRIHANVVVDAARRKAAERQMLTAIAAEPPPAQDDTPAPCGCIVAQARTLRPNYALILDLVDIGGNTLNDAAKALNISVNNATVRLHRARAALKRRLLEHCGVTSMRACADCPCTSKGGCTA